LQVAAAGGAWMVLGISGYVASRRRQGLDLVSTYEVAQPQPVTLTEAEYESVLVALDARHYSPQTIATARRLAGPKRRGIHVLVTLTVPQASPLDAALPDEELAARAVIEQARLQGGQRVSGHVERVRPGQTGRLIVQEAREMRAHAIVLPLPPRTGTTIFGKTLETVLSERPCRVIIESEPADA
ncbi:MAG TPA: universal stress protein, partial [Solirubrobacteraceae bacterium]|nr:universal stress protein [Solirubrobacteraceae bacterium]